MEGLEDVWPRYRSFMLTIGHAVFYFRIRWHLTSLPYIVTSSKQSECYIKCYCTRTNHSYSSIWLPSNQFTRFFMNSLLRFTMVTVLVNDILQNIWLCDLCATDCNLVNHLIFTFNSQGHNLYKLKVLSLEPVKIADYFKENNLFTFCLKIVSSRSNLQSLRI